jgi:hypothetical protein
MAVVPDYITPVHYGLFQLLSIQVLTMSIEHFLTVELKRVSIFACGRL